MVFSHRRGNRAAQPMRQIGTETAMASQIEPLYRFRYRQRGCTLGDIQIQVHQLRLSAAFGDREEKECFPETVARAIVARFGTADELPLLAFVQPHFHRVLANLVRGSWPSQDNLRD